MKTVVGYDNWKTTPPDYFIDTPCDCYCKDCDMIHDVEEFKESGACIWQ